EGGEAAALADVVRGGSEAEQTGGRVGQMLDAIDHAGVCAGAASEIIQAAVRADLEVYGRGGGVGGEAGHRAIGGVVNPNPAVAQVGEEVVADKLTRELEHRG